MLRTLLRRALGRRAAAGPTGIAAMLDAANDAERRQDYARAEGLLREALDRSPDHVDALIRLARLYARQGRLDDARTGLRRALALDDTRADAQLTLGNVTRLQGDPRAAAECYRRALALDPAYLPACINLAQVLREGGEFDAAREVLDGPAAGAASPALDYERAEVARLDGRAEAALAGYRRVLEADPAHIDAWVRCGELQRDAREHERAENAFRRALALAPQRHELHVYLGLALEAQFRFDAAVAAYGNALSLAPDDPIALSNLANVHRHQGNIRAAVEVLERAIRVDSPHAAAIHSNLLLTLNYLADVSPADVAAAHRAWGRRHAASPGQSPHRISSRPARPIRVGYVSPDFCSHSVAHFLLPVIRAHDPARVEVTCYADVVSRDAVTDAFMRSTAHWCEITALGHAAAAARIAADEIDVLVDLAGHTAHHRLEVFARRPARVLVSWLGYPNTTGVDAIDFRLTDAIADPPGPGDAHYTEALVRLPAPFLCYGAPEDAPAVSVPPSLASGRITFGSFNNLPKINPGVLDAWARILGAVPDSRLLVKSGQLADAGVRERFATALAGRGVERGRIELAGRRASPREHLALYGQVDIALDTFPYNGTTTTCEALWMGVPVVALEGDRHAARVGASLLGAAGLGACVARDVAGYIDIATRLAADAAGRTALRQGMRARLAASPLMDATRFARHLEDAFDTMLAAEPRAAGAPFTR